MKPKSPARNCEPCWPREITSLLAPVQKPLSVEDGKKPFVILVAGVNGTGKTTTIGKLAKRLAEEGAKVMLAAGDTFRAAAIEQLRIWAGAGRRGICGHQAGRRRGGPGLRGAGESPSQWQPTFFSSTPRDVCRTRPGLMAELEKIARVIKKLDPTAPHAVLLVLDATTGQNALSQVEAF